VPGAVNEVPPHPTGNKQLRELAALEACTCIVFIDNTSACPDHLLVPALLAELEKSGGRLGFTNGTKKIRLNL
jgi:nickel-dependent lactate racemase